MRQLLQKLLERQTLPHDEQRAHQGIEYGRKEEQIQYEGRQIAPHAQQEDELHQIHQANGQHKRVVPPASRRTGIEHRQTPPNAHIDGHQSNILSHYCTTLHNFRRGAPLDTVAPECSANVFYWRTRKAFNQLSSGNWRRCP